MCGACGRMVVADDVLGEERTLRSQHIVAQTVNGLCRTLPGAPSIQVAGDGWILRSTTGAVYSCSTVNELWTILLAKVNCQTERVLLDRIRWELTTASDLAEAVLLAGENSVRTTELPPQP